MAARSQAGDSSTQALNGAAREGSRRGRAWRYAPLAAWTALIFLLSTGAGSSEHTSLIIEPVVRWLFPHVSEERVQLVHATVRKLAHFTGYAALALFAARFSAYAVAAARTQAPSWWARRRCSIRWALHGPLPLSTA